MPHHLTWKRLAQIVFSRLTCVIVDPYDAAGTTANFFKGGLNTRQAERHRKYFLALSMMIAV